MIVLLTGASGFIGRRLARAITARGHEVVAAVRNPSVLATPDAVRAVPADFARDFDPADWAPRLAGVDAVINAVGILRETRGQDFEAIHTRAPKALFSACAAAGIGRVIQISALGADRDANSRYHLSKRAADDFLASLALPHVIVQPSLVYGPGGTSARLFDTLASLPLVPLPGRGDQRIQPIHIDDLAEAIAALLDDDRFLGQRVPLAGPQPLSLRDFLARLRSTLGLGEARFLAVPLALVSAAAHLGRFLPHSLLDVETLDMLLRGNTADPAPVQRLLGRPARPVEAFVPRAQAPALSAHARLQWLLPVLRASVAIVWIATGIVSLGVYPVEASYALLARVGASGALATGLLYGAALLDLALGIGILVLKRRRWLWLAQIGLIAAYTVIITLRLPEYWLHPYGPILKNLPLLAVLWLLYEFEDE